MDEANRDHGTLSKHREALDLALDACLSILRDELKEGIDARGNTFSSPVVIYAKLAKVVDILIKIQKSQGIAAGKVQGGETAEKLDGIMRELEKGMAEICIKPSNLGNTPGDYKITE